MNPAAFPHVLNGAATTFSYDGHGALSAGASSRLLIDYEEEQRSQILDLLFKPNHGASMHLIKVEIGGDGQSTDGTEASHMHTRNDLSCDRGYEFWLLEEARKRNPKIATYALSWASPYWVGNQTGYYSQDEIDYHVKWLNCTRQYEIGTIDYMGNWNERSWGTPDWTKQFKRAMENAGFRGTKIIIPDGGDTAGIERAMAADAEFKDTVTGLGVHYPCNRPVPSIASVYGKKYWSSEDYSTVGDWAGAACWGRLLNQNFVRMNQTSTIAWSLIWSVYGSGFPYFGNGLMYAFTPWSGFFEAGDLGHAGSSTNGAAIWTNAHTCQFVEVGWKYLAVGAGSGMLTGGGSYVTLVSPGASHFSLVVEKLEGRCLRCAGQTTSTETVAFRLSGGLERMGLVLQLWETNETSHFRNAGNITVGTDGTFHVTVARDSLVTVSSWFNGQSKTGGLATRVPPDSPFPLPHSDTFDNYPVDAEARYFADNGGSFQIAPAPAPAAGRGKVMKQWVRHENGVNRWGRNVPPISLLGNSSWVNISVAVDVRLGDGTPPSPPPPAPADHDFVHWKNLFSGECLDLEGNHRASGSRVDVWNCVSAENERFRHDAATGHLVEETSRSCVSTDSCTAGATLCIVPCASGHVPPMSLVWDFHSTDGTIRPRSDSSSCLQTASKALDADVFVGLCSATPTPQQRWANDTFGTERSGAHAGVCARTDRNGAGVCFVLSVTGEWSWQLQKGTAIPAQGQVGKDPTAEWTRLEVRAVGASATALIDGVVVSTAQLVLRTSGMVSINSGYNVAFFDNFVVSDPAVPHLEPAAARVQLEHASGPRLVHVL